MNISLEDLYHQANIHCYDIKLRYFIEEIISILYYSDWTPLTMIKIEHIDRAIFKYKEASRSRRIYNTKNYFIECLKSSIKEMEIDFLF